MLLRFERVRKKTICVLCVERCFLCAPLPEKTFKKSCINMSLYDDVVPGELCCVGVGVAWRATRAVCDSLEFVPTRDTTPTRAAVGTPSQAVGIGLTATGAGSASSSSLPGDHAASQAAGSNEKKKFVLHASVYFCAHC